MRRSSSAINKRRRATHQQILFMTGNFDVTPKTTEQNLIVRCGNSEAEITINKRLRSRHCTVEATAMYEAPRGLSATAELLVQNRLAIAVESCQ